ncbi:MAG: sugar-binding domain-containing protein, partial [Mycobacteriaceae bacterium]
MTVTRTWSGTVAPLATPWTADVTPANALPDYPRPQCSRPSVAAPRWTNLNGLWQFQPSTADAAVPVGQDLTGQILVPFAPESALSGVMEHHGHMVYRRTVAVPASYRTGGQRVRLNFGAVGYRAAVHVNGTQVAGHVGGYTSFSADITDALTPSGPQEIVVVVHAPVDCETIPVGKQRLTPFEVFYTAASGIWQTVWLEPVPPVSLASVTVTPDLATSSFVVTARIHGDASGAVLSVTAHEGGTVVGGVSGSATDPLRLRIPAPHRWSPDDPFRYALTSTLTAADGRTDTLEGAVGMRSIEVAEVAGVQRIMLNGEPIFLLSTLDQGYWPDGLYTAPTDDALRFDLERTKALGFNTV